MVYQTPERRFDKELTTLVAAALFTIAPAATVSLADFRTAVENKSALILDARPAVFFERGHVPGRFALDLHCVLAGGGAQRSRKLPLRAARARGGVRDVQRISSTHHRFD